MSQCRTSHTFLFISTHTSPLLLTILLSLHIQFSFPSVCSFTTYPSVPLPSLYFPLLPAPPGPPIPIPGLYLSMLVHYSRSLVPCQGCRTLTVSRLQLSPFPPPLQVSPFTPSSSFSLLRSIPLAFPLASYHINSLAPLSQIAPFLRHFYPDKLLANPVPSLSAHPSSSLLCLTHQSHVPALPPSALVPPPLSQALPFDHFMTLYFYLPTASSFLPALIFLILCVFSSLSLFTVHPPRLLPSSAGQLGSSLLPTIRDKM